LGWKSLATRITTHPQVGMVIAGVKMTT